MSESCAVPGCRDAKREKHLLCYPHWRTLSPELQNRLVMTWRKVKDPRQSGRDLDKRLAAYTTARAEAIAIAMQEDPKVEPT